MVMKYGNEILVFSSIVLSCADAKLWIPVMNYDSIWAEKTQAPTVLQLEIQLNVKGQRLTL